ncbi:MAG: YHS domain-containing protein [Ignavibacteria bacterium]|nr:YHS domain-containing protein [Ignavibacteria bacterium]
MVKSLLSSLSNNYENISGNIRERCCHKSEIDGMNSISDSNLVCIVSKETIKSNPERFTYLGKEYTFCSKSCIEKFKSEPLNYIKEGLVCPVMGDEINPEFYTIHNGIKYYFCCKGCIKKFKEAPEKYINGYQEN